MLSSSVVYRGFKPRSGQTKDYEIDNCSFSAKHAVLRRESKDWLAWHQDNVSEWSDMSNHDNFRLMFDCSTCCRINFIYPLCLYPALNSCILPLKSWWVSDCCLTPSEQFFSHIMARRKYISMRWKWCLLCTRPRRFFGFL